MVARTAGYYLIGPGRTHLEQGLRPSSRSGRPGRKVRFQPSWRLPLYAAAWAAGTLAALSLAAHGLDVMNWQTGVALLLMAFPASEAVAALIHRLIAESTRIAPLARLDFTAGIPAEHRVLVVIPSMLSSTASTSDLVHQLSLHWLASREVNAQFALLTDWADADTETLDSDPALLSDATARLRALNRSYPAAPGSAARFVLLHRPRSWSATERRWIGWERKRGKLELLIRQLATGSASGFMPLGSDMRLPTAYAMC